MLQLSNYFTAGLPALPRFNQKRPCAFKKFSRLQCFLDTFLVRCSNFLRNVRLGRIAISFQVEQHSVLTRIKKARVSERDGSQAVFVETFFLVFLYTSFRRCLLTHFLTAPFVCAVILRRDERASGFNIEQFSQIMPTQIVYAYRARKYSVMEYLILGKFFVITEVLKLSKNT